VHIGQFNSFIRQNNYFLIIKLAFAGGSANRRLFIRPIPAGFCWRQATTADELHWNNSSGSSVGCGVGDGEATEADEAPE
jgi:hypothetical protein